MYRVAGRNRDLHDTVTLTLDPDDEVVPSPAPGQFNMLWSFGVGEAPISIAGQTGTTLVHTIRDVGAVTAALCNARVGDPVGVRGPFGVGWDVDRAHGRDLVVVAGGLGLAPVRPIVAALLADRDAFGRASLLVGSRSPDALLYRPELDTWDRRDDLNVQLTVDHGDDTWPGHVGLVTERIEQCTFEPADTEVFICGPEPMMIATARAMAARGVPPGEIQVSLERNMYCATGHCGHCQLGAVLLCRDGPVLTWERADGLLSVRQR